MLFSKETPNEDKLNLIKKVKLLLKNQLNKKQLNKKKRELYNKILILENELLNQFKKTKNNNQLFDCENKEHLQWEPYRKCRTDDFYIDPSESFAYEYLINSKSKKLKRYFDIKGSTMHKKKKRKKQSNEMIRLLQIKEDERTKSKEIEKNIV